MLDWTVLEHGAETLGSDIYPDPTEDRIGFFSMAGWTEIEHWEVRRGTP